MRKHQQCPKCGCEFIGVFPDVTNSVAEKDGSVTLSGSFPLEAYTCADCGYYELYMKTPLREWDTPPEESQYEFAWIRRPPDQKAPFR